MTITITNYPLSVDPGEQTAAETELYDLGILVREGA